MPITLKHGPYFEFSNHHVAIDGQNQLSLPGIVLTVQETTADSALTLITITPFVVAGDFLLSYTIIIP